MSRTSIAATVAAVAGVAPVVALAPRADRSPGRLATVREIVSAARGSGASGWELVDRATALVSGSFTHDSRWHLWETPTQALAAGRGRSTQYNVVLARVLRELGFDVEVVHASRVRQGAMPWWCAGHTWLHVTVEGRTHDVCAGRLGNRAGAVHFTQVTEARPFRVVTFIDTAVALLPFVSASVWRHLIAGDDVPRWLYRPFGEDV